MLKSGFVWICLIHLSLVGPLRVEIHRFADNCRNNCGNTCQNMSKLDDHRNRIGFRVFEDFVLEVKLCASPV